MTRLPDVDAWWWAHLTSLPGVRTIQLSAEAALGASALPEPLHGDPQAACSSPARQMDVLIVTRNRRILDYAKAGLVATIPC